jgi:hypothetical protein
MLGTYFVDFVCWHSAKNLNRSCADSVELCVRYFAVVAILYRLIDHLFGGCCVFVFHFAFSFVLAGCPARKTIIAPFVIHSKRILECLIYRVSIGFFWQNERHPTKHKRMAFVFLGVS